MRNQDYLRPRMDGDGYVPPAHDYGNDPQTVPTTATTLLPDYNTALQSGGPVRTPDFSAAYASQPYRYMSRDSGPQRQTLYEEGPTAPYDNSAATAARYESGPAAAPGYQGSSTSNVMGGNLTASPERMDSPPPPSYFGTNNTAAAANSFQPQARQGSAPSSASRGAATQGATTNRTGRSL